MQKQLLSIKEFSAIYNISRTQIYRLVDRGEIRILKIGRASRIRADEAVEWLSKLSQKELA